jgi:hypothetical protein
MTATDPSPRASAWWCEWPTLAAILLGVVVVAWAQYAFEGLRDSDSYFHTRAARELAAHGVSRQFPQTAFSTWRDSYSDKDFLFHVALIPFQWFERLIDPPVEGVEDLVGPGKQAAVALYLVFFVAMALTLRRVGARAVWLWLLLFVATDAVVLKAMLAIRPGLLGMTFVLLEIGLLVQRRGRWLFLAGALHALSHSSFILLPGLAVATDVAHRLRGERLPWRVTAAAFAGPALTLVVNPYFPNNLALTWTQLVDVGLTVWGMGAAVPTFLFGPELLATRTDLFLGAFAALLPAAAAIVAFLASSEAHPGRRLSTEGLALLLINAMLLVLAFLSERFFDFLFPALIVFAGRAWTDYFGPVAFAELRRQRRRAVGTVAALLAFCALAGQARGGVARLWSEAGAMITLEVQRPAVEFLRRNAAPGDLVYHSFWWDFSILYHYRPEGRYVCALDPMFFYRYDRELFDKALAAYNGESPDLFRMLRQDFGARWVFIPKAPAHFALFNQIRADARFHKAYEDDQVVIARVP